jgi:hypothetical protein
MSALPNRMLRHLAVTPATPAELCDLFAAYTISHRTESVARLQRAGLAESDAQGRLQLTASGRAATALPKPPRWSAPRRQPRS